MKMIDLDVNDTRKPVWLRSREERVAWRRDVGRKAALTGIAVISLVLLALVLSPNSRFSLFKGVYNKLPTSTNPNITYVQPQFFHSYNSERVNIRYGPFLVDGNDVNHGMAGFRLTNATKPCSDCMITFLQANLEYEDGSYANAATGMWLHHMVLINPSQPNAVCPTHPDPVFASGNERTPADLCVHGTRKAGYNLTSEAQLVLTAEFMNETPVPTSVYIIVTYEYVPNPPPSFREVKAVWLDIGGICGHSDYPVPKDETAFSITAEPWTSSISGEIMLGAAHPHDGGLNVQILKDGHDVCTSAATYGGRKGYVENNGLEHISDMSLCTGLGRMEKGEEWSLVARYDLNKHDAMLGMNDVPEPIMGIALVYVALDKETEDASKLE